MAQRRRRLTFETEEPHQPQVPPPPIPSPIPSLCSSSSSSSSSTDSSSEEQRDDSFHFEGRKKKKRKVFTFENSDEERKEDERQEAMEAFKMQQTAGISTRPSSPPDVHMQSLGDYDDVVIFAGKKLVVTPNYNKTELASMPASLKGENRIDEGFLYVAGVVFKHILKQLPFGDWWSLKATCKVLRDRPEWKCRKFLQNRVLRHANNFPDAGRFHWDPALVDENFVRDSAKAIARCHLLGVDGKSKAGAVRKFLRKMEPQKANINVNWRRQESHMFRIENKHEQTTAMIVFQLPSCAPSRHSNSLVLVNSKKFVRVYRTRDFSISASIPFQSMRKATYATCNAEGDRILVFFRLLTESDEKDESKEESFHELEDKRMTDVEIFALSNKGLSPYRRVRLPNQFSLTISRKCLWPDQGLVVASRHTRNKTPIVFSLLDVSSNGNRIPRIKKTFTPHKVFTNIYEQPGAIPESIRYQTLIPSHNSESNPLLCRIKTCETISVSPVPDHKLIFYSNAFSDHQTGASSDAVPTRYTTDLTVENDVKALAFMRQGIDMVLILARAVKITTEAVDKACSYKVKKYLPLEYAQTKENAEKEEEQVTCQHHSVEWHGREKILRLFVWVVGSDTIQCMRYMYIKSSLFKTDSLMLYHTDFDSALHHVGCAPPVRILVDGYQIVIPSNRSFYHTSLTNIDCCIEMQYNTNFTSLMPFVFFRHGVLLQATVIERKPQQSIKNFPKEDNIKEAYKLFLHIKVYADQWTAEHTLTGTTFFHATSKTRHGLRPPIQNVATHACSVYEMMVADGVFPKVAKGSKEYKEKAAQHCKIIRLMYHNVGSAPAYICKDDDTE